MGIKLFENLGIWEFENVGQYADVLICQCANDGKGCHFERRHEARNLLDRF